MKTTSIIGIVIVIITTLAQAQPKKLSSATCGNIKRLAARVFTANQIVYSDGREIEFDARCQQKVKLKDFNVQYHQQSFQFVQAYDYGQEYNGIVRVTTDGDRNLIFYIIKDTYHFYWEGDYAFVYAILDSMDKEATIENITEFLKAFLEKSMSNYGDKVVIGEITNEGDEKKVKFNYRTKNKQEQKTFVISFNLSKRTANEVYSQAK